MNTTNPSSESLMQAMESMRKDYSVHTEYWSPHLHGILDALERRARELDAARTPASPAVTAGDGFVLVPKEPPMKELLQMFGDWCGHNKWIDAEALRHFWNRSLLAGGCIARMRGFDAPRSGVHPHPREDAP